MEETVTKSILKQVAEPFLHFAAQYFVFRYTKTTYLRSHLYTGQTLILAQGLSLSKRPLCEIYRICGTSDVTGILPPIPIAVTDWWFSYYNLANYAT